LGNPHCDPARSVRTSLDHERAAVAKRQIKKAR
jgi:hypothetical protein